MKQPQLFIKVGTNQYAVVEEPVEGKDLYIWDERRQRIRLYIKQALK